MLSPTIQPTRATRPSTPRYGVRLALVTALIAAAWLVAATAPAANGQATVSPTPATTATATPAEGPFRFEDYDPAVVYSGNWTTVSDPRASGGTVHRSSEAGATAKLAFAGTSITWFASRGPDRGMVKVVIDNNTLATVDLWGATEAFQQSLTYSNLGEGSHTLQVQVTGTHGGASSANIVDLDAIDALAAFVTPVPASAAGAPTSTPAPAPGATGTPAPIVTPPTAPTAPHDARYFAQTSYRVDDDPFWDYFNARGGVETFGYPISRTFQFLGCTTQFFQRQLMQQCGNGAAVQTMNLLDPDLMPYNQINFSTFPAHDPNVASAAPPPGTPNYGAAVLDHIRRVAPDTFEGLPVRFYTTFVTTVPGSNPQTNPDLTALVNLEIWGFPTSNPAHDPANGSFVYQRFQRGIMHFDAATGATQGILLADYFKGIIVGQPGPTLPPDLMAQAATSRFFRQYCPGQPGWTCRPNDLPGTDLTFAFEPQ